MKISHEVPKVLFPIAKTFNDYDYYLDYLYDDKDYCDFFQKSLKQGRTVIMDSSLFEFHPIVPPIDRFYNHVCEFGEYGNTIEYIVTDVLNDKDATIEKFEEWDQKYRKTAPGIAIGVVQGSTLADLVDCYKYMVKHADKIAIPFDSKGFEELVDDETDQLAIWAKGRQRFVQYLITENIWKNKPVHLLGCSYVWEFSCPLYRDHITSLDTSSPIIYGIKRMKYEEYGNDRKPSIRLCDLIDYQPTALEMSLIKDNIKKFREIANEV